VCDNKCLYGNSCPAGIKKPPSLLNQCTGGLSSNCDPQVTSEVMSMCEKEIKGGKKKGEALGICLYKSHLTGYEMALRKLWNNFLKYITDLSKTTPHSLRLPEAFEAIRRGLSFPDPENFDLLTCFPVPVALLPPPFCIKPMTHYSSINVLRICTEGERPVRTTLGETQECVLPTPASNDVKNTFMNPCVRVTYIKRSTELGAPVNPNPKYINYYDAKWRELLVTHNDLVPERTLMRFADVYDEVTGSFVNNSSRHLIGMGFNDAPYTDICGRVDPKTGSISTYPPYTLIDSVNSTRRFELDICTDHITGRDICMTPFDRFSKMNICVKELRSNGEKVIHGCVNRPDMNKPKVSFCNNTLNDKTNSCMKTEVESVGVYEFKGPMTECTDIQGDVSLQGEGLTQKLCTLQTENPFGFQAILTNRLYINRASTPGNNICNSNMLPFTSTNRTDCECAIDQLGLCDKKVVGAERLCLLGYADVYNSLAKGWCKDDESSDPKKICNRVCTKSSSTTKEPLIDIVNRTTPIPTNNGPLTSSCSYSGVEPEFPYRVRNPVEDDLCVDAYTIEFNKECQSKEKGANFPTELCNKVLAYCSELKPGSTNQYKNFDECQWRFKECLNSPDSLDNERFEFRNGMTYTYGQMKQFVSR
jgi:hypothetical protein